MSPLLFLKAKNFLSPTALDLMLIEHLLSPTLPLNSLSSQLKKKKTVNALVLKKKKKKAFVSSEMLCVST